MGVEAIPPLWDEIIHELLGTPKAEYEVSEEAEALFERDMAFTQYVDQRIFRCTCCGWWCDISEEVSEDYGLDEWTCSNCAEES